jgi:subtilisin family serine protease
MKKYIFTHKKYFLLLAAFIFVTIPALYFAFYKSQQPVVDQPQTDILATSIEKYVSTEAGQNSDLSTSLLKDEAPSQTPVPSATPVVSKTGKIEAKESRQVVKFTKELSAQEKTTLEQTYNVKFTEEKSVKGVYTITTTNESKISELKTSSAVENIETDIPVKLLAQTLDWGVERIGAPKVWGTFTGSGVVVAVIDTGVQTTHPDLSGVTVAGYDFVNSDVDAMDDNGHGTHVAGIVAAVNNSAGTVGAANGAKIMPVKVLNESGYGYLSDVVKGIYYATDNGARVINLSLGTTSDSDSLRKAVDYAYSKGVVVVAAAGNSASGACAYPAAYASVICVVATDTQNKLASFSNYGGEIAAPGVSNYSTYINSQYARLSGTSMASPHVAGAAALIMQQCKCGASQVRERMHTTAVDLGSPGIDGIFGYGMVDVVAATAVTPTPTEVPTLTPTPTVTGIKEVTDRNPQAAPVNQRLQIIDPKQTRIFVKNQGELSIRFGLIPIYSGTKVSKIEAYLDNEKVHETTSQDTTYKLSLEGKKPGQYVFRVIARFNDNTQQQQRLLIEVEPLKVQSKSGRN